MHNFYHQFCEALNCKWLTINSGSTLEQSWLSINHPLAPYIVVAKIVHIYLESKTCYCLTFLSSHGMNGTRDNKFWSLIGSVSDKKLKLVMEPYKSDYPPNYNLPH